MDPTNTYTYPVNVDAEGIYEFNHTVTDPSGSLLAFGPYKLVVGCVPEAASSIQLDFLATVTNPSLITIG